MEIERKFLIKEIPDMSDITPVRYERCILESSDGNVKRVQRKGDVFEYEEKKKVDDFQSEKVKRQITKEEYDSFLLNKENNLIVRDGYLVSHNPEISIKVYKEKFEGLIRVEIEFSSKEEAKNFIPLPWFGKEITGTVLANDGELYKLDREDFLNKLYSSQ